MIQNRIEIRFAKPDELGRVTELIGELHKFQAMTDCEPPEIDDIKRDLTRCNEHGQQFANNKNTFVLVAVDTTKSETAKKHLIGYLIYTQSCFIRLGRHIHIGSFFIEEDYRRHGLGAMFMRLFTFHARLLGNDKFDVPYANDNLVAIGFYKRMKPQCVNDQYQIFVHHVNMIDG